MYENLSDENKLAFIGPIEQLGVKKIGYFLKIIRVSLIKNFVCEMEEDFDEAKNEGNVVFLLSKGCKSLFFVIRSLKLEFHEKEAQIHFFPKIYKKPKENI
jgi:hypothetical protein